MAAAHVQSQVVLHSLAISLLSCDDIEGVIWLTKAYCKTRTSNLSRVEALTDLHGKSSTVTFRQHPCFIAESSVYTAELRVCSCFTSLGPGMVSDVKVAEDLALADGMVALQRTEGEEGRCVSTFKLRRTRGKRPSPSCSRCRRHLSGASSPWGLSLS